MLKQIVSLIAVTLIIVGCSTTARKHRADGPIPFRTVLSSTYSLADTAAVYLIDNNAQWTKVWNMAMGRQDPFPNTPEMDFKRDMVLAIFMGHKNAAGYRNEIIDITQKGEKLMVVVKNHHSREGMVLPVVTSPFHIVTIPKGKYKLEVHYGQIDE